MIKLLVILCSHEMNIKWINNIKILYDYMKLLNIEVHYCGISNQNDFHHYESILSFHYKIINTKSQFNKICDFITDYKSYLNYTWFMKIRPDIRLIEPINLNILSEHAINARAREYYGPRTIINGMSVGGKGLWNYIKAYKYDKYEHNIVLDDQLFLFHSNIVNIGAFNKVNIKKDNEWCQNNVFKSRNIPLNVIGINVELSKYNTFSGNINSL
jgi:hypothetical protein